MALSDRPRIRKVNALLGRNDANERDPGDQAPNIPVDQHPGPDQGDPGQLAPLRSDDPDARS